MRWPGEDLRDLAERLVNMRFEILDPPPPAVAVWVDKGLTAYDACYVALAEQLGVPLVTVDPGLLGLAPGVAVPV